MFPLELNQLEKFLVEAKLLTKKQAADLVERAKGDARRFKELVLNQGAVSADDFRKVEAHLLGIPYVNLTTERISPAVLRLVPEPIARRHNIVAYKATPETVELAMLEPTDLQTLEFIGKSVGRRVRPRLTDDASLKNALRQYQKSLQSEFGDLIKKEAAGLAVVESATGREELEKMAEDLPIVRIVDTLLRHAVLQRASDIHLEPYERELVIRYRIDGLLHDAMILPKAAAAGLVARIKVLSNLRLDEKRLPQDGRFKIEQEEGKISLRVSVLPTYFGEKIVLRLLPETEHGLSLESIGFHGEGLEIIQATCRRANGLILVTGPTGSGKSTTLYSLLEILNRPDVNISTVEDPIEYQMPRVNQTQVKPEIGLTFAAGLRALLRQDPDIIMVGEIRDKETAALAINAALTGHLVLSTLHTNSAAGAVPRLLDMGVEPFLLSSTISVVVAQRLVRRLCPKRESHKPSKADLLALGTDINWTRVLDNLRAEKIVTAETAQADLVFYRPLADNDCPDGYQGRSAITEVLSVSPAIRELIVQGKTAATIEKEARREGMMTMLEDGIFKSVQGLTTLAEVLRVTTSE